MDQDYLQFHNALYRHIDALHSYRSTLLMMSDAFALTGNHHLGGKLDNMAAGLDKLAENLHRSYSDDLSRQTNMTMQNIAKTLDTMINSDKTITVVNKKS